MFASPLPSTSAAARAELAAFLLDQKSREGEEDEDSDNETAKWSCDAMRKKIATFLASKEMTQTAFLKECGGIAPNSYGNFMKLKGAWNGTQNGTFWGAQRFFLRRDAEKRAEAAMMPTAEKKRKRVDQADDKTAKKTQLAELLQKVRALPGPEKARPCHPPFCAKNCPGTAVYDTCDEVRKKSLGFMAASGMTQSAFIKEIGSHPPSWNSFIKMKGKFEGQRLLLGRLRFPREGSHRPRREEERQATRGRGQTPTPRDVLRAWRLPTQERRWQAVGVHREVDDVRAAARGLVCARVCTWRARCIQWMHAHAVVVMCRGFSRLGHVS